MNMWILAKNSCATILIDILALSVTDLVLGLFLKAFLFKWDGGGALPKSLG